MQWFVSGAFALSAVVNLAPVSGVLSVVRLESLYGIPFADPSLEILMRHRALLFAVVGVALLVAAFRPRLRLAAGAAGLFSMLSFVLLVGIVGGSNENLVRVAMVDCVASALLIPAMLLDYRGRRADC